MSSYLSYVNPSADSPWGTYLMQVDRVCRTWATWRAGSRRSSAPSAR
jgi:hypothetical protein